MGERQLRRLFQQHLGASPISVAQTRRILLAKQLIQDTSLPMTEVAAAAGFGSMRRFNETFQQLYRRPPKALRRAGVSDETGRHHRRGHGQAGLSAALRLGRHLGVPARPRHPRRRSRVAPTATPARSRSATTAACWSSNRRSENCLRGHRSRGKPAERCRRSSPASAGCSIWPPTRWRSARISARTRCWRRWSPRARACGCPARGTGSNSRCAPSSASRSPSRRRRGWPANWWRAMARRWSIAVSIEG